jgi:hypothetical protein
MNLVQYEPHDIRTVSMPLEDWKRLLQQANLTGSVQDRRIIDSLRYAVLNGH